MTEWADSALPPQVEHAAYTSLGVAHPALTVAQADPAHEARLKLLPTIAPFVPMRVPERIAAQGCSEPMLAAPATRAERGK